MRIVLAGITMLSLLPRKTTAADRKPMFIELLGPPGPKIMRRRPRAIPRRAVDELVLGSN